MIKAAFSLPNSKILMITLLLIALFSFLATASESQAAYLPAHSTLVAQAELVAQVEDSYTQVNSLSVQAQRRIDSGELWPLLLLGGFLSVTGLLLLKTSALSQTDSTGAIPKETA